MSVDLGETWQSSRKPKGEFAAISGRGLLWADFLGKLNP